MATSARWSQSFRICEKWEFMQDWRQRQTESCTAHRLVWRFSNSTNLFLLIDATCHFCKQIQLILTCFSCDERDKILLNLIYDKGNGVIFF